MIEGVTTSGAIPVLERMMQFAGRRHALIANNVANASTPGFQPSDVSVAAFQQQLADAIDARRTGQSAAVDSLQLDSTAQVEAQRDSLTLHPEPLGDNLMFHDGNDRDVERIMQDLVENFMTFRTAAQFLRSQFDLIETAIRERV